MQINIYDRVGPYIDNVFDNYAIGVFSCCIRKNQ